MYCPLMSPTTLTQILINIFIQTKVDAINSSLQIFYLLSISTETGDEWSLGRPLNYWPYVGSLQACGS